MPVPDDTGSGGSNGGGSNPFASWNGTAAALPNPENPPGGLSGPLSNNPANLALALLARLKAMGGANGPLS
jgi:hypothetical protein